MNLSKNKVEDTITLLIQCVTIIYNIMDINQGREKALFWQKYEVHRVDNY